MSVAPLPTPPSPRRLSGLTSARPHPGATRARLARRRLLVLWTKRLLPVAALALLATVALWPEIGGDGADQRIAFRRVPGLGADTAELTEPHYQSVDAKGRPYTVTADTATQIGSARVNLTRPKADMTLGNGNWLMVQARHGVFIQHDNQLDLSGNVTLYRDDGTTMVSSAATVDLKQGAAAGSSRTHAEGPFGTLDSQGFALADKGDVVQFTGPARLVLNGSRP